ncbi:MAG: adenylate/guanylate cyclase domain-containing protein, partial [Acidovorax temperans]
VKGKAQAVAIFSPVALQDALTPQKTREIAIWQRCLDAYRAQDWAECSKLLTDLNQTTVPTALYDLYTARVKGLEGRAPDPERDSATTFDTK